MLLLADATMPFGRPALDDGLDVLRFAQDNDYLACGAAWATTTHEARVVGTVAY